MSIHSCKGLYAHMHTLRYTWGHRNPPLPLQVADLPWASGPEDSLAFTAMGRQDRAELCIPGA